MNRRKKQDIIRITIGFLVAILLHLLILLIYLLSNQKILFPASKPNNQKMTIDLRKFVPPPAPKPVVVPKPTVVPKPIEKPKPQPKREIIDKSKKRFVAKEDTQENNITKESKTIKKAEKSEPKKEEKVEKKIAKSIVKKEQKKIPKQSIPKRHTSSSRAKRSSSHSPLAKSLMGSSRARSIQTKYSRREVSAATKRVINKLYGKEFDSFGEAQKRFIENNLAMIHTITQRTLSRYGYPEVAARTGQEGVNIVSFYLHPNGNISNLRLEYSMGYEILDQNTLKVIRIAYKDYPLPKKKTKIKFYVEYSIY
jgi:TonB family protein